MMMRFGIAFLRFGVALIGLLLLVWHLLRWWTGDQHHLVRLLDYVAPWLLLFLLPAFVVTLLIGRRYEKLLIALPTLLIGIPLLPQFLPRPEAEPAVGLQLKVMSYSVCSANRNTPAVIENIRQVQPDLLLLQEITPEVASTLRRELRTLYPARPFYLAYESETRQAIVSRYRLSPLGAASEQDRTQKVRMRTPEGPITVWNVHASQPRFWEQHSQELLTLAEAIPQVGGPLIVGGDFNTTDRTEQYRRVAQSLHDVHWEAGWGFGFTFPAVDPDLECQTDIAIPFIGPFIRIDHIFYNDHFFSHQTSTLPSSGGSDHLPIVAELSLRR
jgi:vancomycin resistance protein VanJ